MILHTVNKSYFSHQCFSQALEYASAGDIILLIEEGVYNALPKALDQCQARLEHKPLRIIALTEDLKARGLVEQIADAIEQTDYQGLVDLVSQCNSQLAWS